LSILDMGIATICKGIAKEKISVFLGLAGASSADYADIICEHIKYKQFGKVKCGIDAQNAVAASLGTCDGIAVIIGTGTIALSQKDGQLLRTGGYGYLFGDEGSGFAIGKDAIVAALKDESGYGKSTLITELVRKKCGKPIILDAISDFYKGGKRMIADYAPIVFEAFKEGDDVAEEIIKSNMCGIAELICGGGRHFDDKKTDVYLCGGITKQADIILDFIYEALGKNRDKYNINICKRSQVYGALVLAGMEEKQNA